MTTQALAARPTDDAIEQVLVNGDLSKLTPIQRVSYYNSVCQSLDLNPLTKPFAYISLNGKLVLYALKDCTEQLRSKRAVSVTISARETTEDCYVVTARASLVTGRQDESIGAVSIGGLKGESRANAMMKAETKAKRRVTLSICGLGILDETEIDSIPGAQPGYVIEAPTVATSPDTVGGEKSATPSEPSVPNGGDSGASDLKADIPVMPAGARLILKVGVGRSGAKGEITFHRAIEGRETFLTWKDQVVGLASELCQNREPCFVDLKQSASGNWRVEGLMRVPDNYASPADVPPVGDITASDIPF